MKDTLRISKKKVSINLHVIKGKEGDFFVAYSPTLNVSGYGRTKSDAEQSFIENMHIFYEDFMTLSTKNQLLYLASLGWKKENLHNKNFSAVSVDEDGNLQNFDLEDVEVKELAFA